MQLLLKTTPQGYGCACSCPSDRCLGIRVVVPNRHDPSCSMLV
jgi:hypothetical protein